MTTDDVDGYAGGVPTLGAQMEVGEVATFWAGIFTFIGAFIMACVDWCRDIPRNLKRVRIIARVQLVAGSVGDAEQLYETLFILPPHDPGHDSYRRSFVALALERKKTREQWLMFADMLDGLQAFEEYPLDAWLVLRRQPRPALTAPRQLVPVDTASVPQGLFGVPIGPTIQFPWFAMILAVIAAGSLFTALWMRGDSIKNHARAVEAEDRNAGLAGRMMQAEEAMQKNAAVLADYQTRVEDMANKDASRERQLADIRRKAKERTNAVTDGSGARRSDDEWVRDFEAASVDGPVPSGSDPAAAPGVLNGVPDGPGGEAVAGDRPTP